MGGIQLHNNIFTTGRTAYESIHLLNCPALPRAAPPTPPLGHPWGGQQGSTRVSLQAITR
eukprot:9484912-Pyramimonas_sp.AAC.1